MRPGGPPPVARISAGAAVAALVAALVALPLLRLAQVVWQEGAGNLPRLLGSGGRGEAVRNPVVLAVAVTAAAVPIGVVLALVLRRPDLPGRAFWRAAVLLPVFVPDFVLGYSWTQAYARAGFTDTLLGWHWSGLLGPAGGWLVLVVNAAPLAYLVVAVGLAARAEPDLERAARVSGAGGTTALLTITLRLLLPAVMAASVLVFVLTLAAFAIPQVLGTPGGFSTVTTRIYAGLSIGSDPASFVQAVTLALLLVVVAAVCVAPADALLGSRLEVSRPAVAPGAPATAGRAAVGRAMAAGLATYLVLSTALPLAALVLSSVTRAVGVPPTPANWSLAHFREVLTPRTVDALGRSLGLAVVAATLLVVLGGLIATVGRPPRGGAPAPPRRACDRHAGHAHARAARLHAGGRPAHHLRALAGRHADPDPAGLPGQAVGLRAPADRRGPGTTAPGGAARRPGERRRRAHRRAHRHPEAPGAGPAGCVAGLLPHRPARGDDVEPPVRPGERDAGGHRAERPGTRQHRGDRGAVGRPHPARRRTGRTAVAGPRPAPDATRQSCGRADPRGGPCRLSPSARSQPSR